MNAQLPAQQLWQQLVAQGGEGAGLFGVLVDKAKDWVCSLRELLSDIDGRDDRNERRDRG